MSFYTNIMINYLIFISLILIIGILVYMLFSIKNKEATDQGGAQNLQNRRPNLTKSSPTWARRGPGRPTN